MDFDDGAADQLIAACDKAAETLREQRGPRASVTGAAQTILIGAPEDLARQVRFARKASWLPAPITCGTGFPR